MAQQHFEDCYVEVNSTDYSNHAVSATVNLSKEQLDDTAFGDSARSSYAGMEVHSIDVEFQQDFASSIDSEIWDALNGETAITVKVRPTSSAASASNPEYSVSCKVFEYTPIDTSVGDFATFTQTFTGVGTVTRTVA